MITTICENIEYPKVVELLNAAAKESSILFKCSLIVSDMSYCYIGLSSWYHTRTKEPYYIAIRTSGVQYGTRARVLNDCEVLGSPIIVYKFEQGMMGGINVTKQRGL